MWYCPVCDAEFAEPTASCPADGTRPVRISDAPADPIGRVIDGRFTITGRVGDGGMGAVYRAMQHSVDREVAIKIIHPHYVSDLVAVKRFFREARLASKLAHANTVTVLDFGQTDDQLLYLVMELVDGCTLSEVMKKEGALGVERSVAIAVQMCEGLEAAHELDIVHRDLKPSNIMLLCDRHGRETVKLLDFGLAKTVAGNGATLVTQSDVMVGTPRYMAPEPMLGHEVDHRADQYSLGVILYQLLSGRVPFGSDTPTGVLAQHALETPESLGDEVPAGLRQIVSRMMEKEPARRYASTAEVRVALSEGLRHGFAVEDEPVAEETPVPIATRTSRLRRVAVGASLVLGMGLIAAYALFDRGPAPSSAGPPAPAIAPPDARAAPAHPRASRGEITDAAVMAPQSPSAGEPAAATPAPASTVDTSTGEAAKPRPHERSRHTRRKRSKPEPTTTAPKPPQGEDFFD